MEERDYFSLRSTAMCIWLGGVLLVAALIAAFFPPAFWLCAPGVVLLFVGKIAQSARTGRWATWQGYDGSINWFEGWAMVTGIVLNTVPFVAILLRDRLA